jgi:hypothetical protein
LCLPCLQLSPLCLPNGHRPLLHLMQLCRGMPTTLPQGPRRLPSMESPAPQQLGHAATSSERALELHIASRRSSRTGRGFSTNMHYTATFIKCVS